MKKVSSVALLVMTTFFCMFIDPAMCRSQDREGFKRPVHRCYMCGMYTTGSNTEFRLHLNDGSVEYACCLHCVYLLQDFLKDRNILRLETRDFTTGAFINAGQAYYLEGSSIIPEGSMAPFILAFSEKESAERYRHRYGGKIVDLAKAMEIVAQFDK